MKNVGTSPIVLAHSKGGIETSTGQNIVLQPGQEAEWLEWAEPFTKDNQFKVFNKTGAPTHEESLDSSAALNMETVCQIENVREYCEGYPVELVRTGNGRLAILARNQSEYDCTAIDLEDLIEWLKKSKLVK